MRLFYCKKNLSTEARKVTKKNTKKMNEGFKKPILILTFALQFYRSVSK
jgi:hypothetical protein